jgi:hypothetical protein
MKMHLPPNRWHEVGPVPILEIPPMVHPMHRALLIPILIVSSMLARPSSAQVTDSDLVRENERLTTKVRDLEAALEAALKRIASLEAALAGVEEQPSVTVASNPAPTTSEPPAASAESALAVIRQAFAAAVASGEIAPYALPNDESARTRHLRSIQRWVAGANRTFKAAIEWPVVVVDSATTGATDGLLQLQVWNPETSSLVGDPFTVPVSRRIVERVNRPRQADDAGPRVFVLDGVFVPNISINESRVEVGPFDKPRFVGPLVEMTWRVETRGIGPWSPPAEATAVADED